MVRYFYNVVPGLSRFLPSDTYHVYKKGVTVKVETSLYEFSKLKMKWEYMRLDYIFDGAATEPYVLRIDHARKYYGSIHYYSKSEKIIHLEVDYMMREDIKFFTMIANEVEFTKVQSSFLGWNKKDKTEMLGSYKSDFYNISGLKFVQRKRCEHLSAEEVKRNDDKDFVEILANGLDIMLLFRVAKKIPKEPLPPVPPCQVTWETYINSENGQPPTLGRAIKQKETLLPFNPQIAMTSDFPIPRELIVSILEVVAPFKHFAYLHEFTKTLPDGFPVQLEIPIKASISAKYTFLECKVTQVPIDVFRVPSDFKQVTFEWVSVIGDLPSQGSTYI